MLRRNCTHSNDFIQQANLLRLRLQARGYSKSLLRKAFNQALRQSRNSLLYKTKTNNPQQTVRFITRYSSQHAGVRNILERHLLLLCEDPILTKYVNSKPEITFRRSRSLRDKLTSSHYTNRLSSHTPANGMTQCGKCPFCPWIKVGTSFMLPNGELFVPNFHANCDTQGVVYPMTCKCKDFYVGKTTRNFCLKIKDHIYYSAGGKMITSISRHLDLYHRFDTSNI